MNKKESSLSFQNIFQHQTKLAAYIIACMTILVLGLSYALFLRVDSNSANQVVTAGDLSFTYKDGSTISSSGHESCFLPMSDDEAGLYNSNCSYQFSAQNSGTLSAHYTFKLIDNGSSIASSKLKYVLKKQNESGVLEVLKSGLVSELSDGLLTEEDISPKAIVVYSIQVYIFDDSTIDTDISKAVNYTIDGSGLVKEDGVNPEKPTYSYCELNPDAMTCQITALAKTDTTNLAVDDYGNTRYIGKNPNNYVSIDGDIWRIIGVMKDVDDGTGNKSDRVKLIRSESMGSYSWDTSESSINRGWGVNEWSQADLMKLLNPGYESETVGGSLYWNNKSGTCYSDENNTTTSCNFTSTGIKDKLKNMIGNAVWNTGASIGSDQIASKFYTEERGTRNGKICTRVSGGNLCNDAIDRTTTWTGKIGLMYPSDYGYATSGGSGADRATCLNKELRNWKDSSVSDCPNNDWLFKNDSTQWTLSPSASSTYAYDVCDVHVSGSVYGTDGHSGLGVRPVGYLLPSVKISSGTGSESDPFVLEG